MLLKFSLVLGDAVLAEDPAAELSVAADDGTTRQGPVSAGAPTLSITRIAAGRRTLPF